MSRLETLGINAGYAGANILDGVDLAIPDGQVTVLIGPNGCGKSTLLKSMARILRPTAGHVLLDGKDIHALNTRSVAAKLGLLPQGPIAPEGLSVRELVGQGRFPHQSLLRQWTRADEDAVNGAMAIAGITDFADRPVDTLSGGQRQRCWVAMVLAQQTDLILLDEPTTFLDLKVQVDLMDLLAGLAHERGRTLVIVLHELSLAAAYADYLVMMKDGQIVCAGQPDDIFTAERLHDVFGLRASVLRDPASGRLVCVPTRTRHPSLLVAAPVMTAAADTSVTVRHPVRAWSGLPALLGLLVGAFLLHIAVGAKPLPLGTVVDALTHFDPKAFDHVIILNLRLPRAVLAIVVGASLSLSGALMQGVTRNPLADPGLLGLTTGAAFAVVMVTAFLGAANMAVIPWIAMAGALGAAVVVYVIARLVPGGATPLSLTLSGAAVSAFLGALISIAHLLGGDTFENLRVWLTGGLAGRDITLLWYVAPWLGAALVAGLLLAPRVTVLAMGDEVAQGLGVRTGPLKAQLLAVVVVLTACSVALAGPLGFIGLVIPHVVRLYVGSDYRWIAPYAALTGAVYLLGIDIVARIAIPPREISTGILTALVGAPLFVHLVRQRLR